MNNIAWKSNIKQVLNYKLEQSQQSPNLREIFFTYLELSLTKIAKLFCIVNI